MVFCHTLQEEVGYIVRGGGKHLHIEQEQWYTLTRSCHHCNTEELEDYMFFVKDGVRDGTILCQDCYYFYLEISGKNE
ncbi:hypothetical protein SAMN04488081_1741 [Salimicrobium album]|uniref:Uncharacterized protein n=2 Tax=Salimicrobium TaxID=351195 RepID=A0ABY1KS18_9BACI|nr:hypothetical protein SAMN04488081_1741 [Salimicrobium album]SIS69724.1 hypothetical protein SAMN05421758_10461 [Salimicrobium salexigens]